MDLTILFDQLLTIETRLNALIQFQLDDPSQIKEFNHVVSEQRKLVLEQYKDRYPDVIRLFES